jgi:hypothetical protein
MSAAPPATAPEQTPGELLGVSVNHQVISFSRGAPGKLCTQAPIDGLDAGEDVAGIDIRPADGDPYALSSAGNIYTLEVASGPAGVANPTIGSGEALREITLASNPRVTP